MKQYFEQLDKILQKYEFEESFSLKENGQYTKWFTRKNQQSDLVETCLRFEYKRYTQVISIHVGWHHQQSHNFCVDALKVNWPEGFTWLEKIGFINWPCLLMHNLGGFLDFPLYGIDVKDRVLNSSHINVFIEKVLDSSDFMFIDTRALLTRYIQDNQPFSWQLPNSAIRIALTAGLIKSLRADTRIFDECANTHIQLIQRDMFQMGDAADWIKNLSSKMKQQGQ